MKLLIHVGPAKTGTSSVQHILRTHDNSVIYYPKMGLWADGSHHNLIFNFFNDNRRPEVAKLDVPDVLEKIAVEAKGLGRDILISSEDLISRDISSLIEALRGYIGESIDAEVILVCREHFSRMASLYNQSVKDPVTSTKFEPGEFIRQQPDDILCYASSIRRLKKINATLSVINYHPATSFSERFLCHVGFAEGKVETIEQRNVSLSIKGLIATLAANNIASSREDRDRYFAALRKMRKFFAPSRFIFDQDSVISVKSRVDSDRKFLEEEYGVVLPAPDIANDRNEFYLSAQDLDDILTVCIGMGEEGRAVFAFTEKYAHK